VDAKQEGERGENEGERGLKNMGRDLIGTVFLAGLQKQESGEREVNRKG